MITNKHDLEQVLSSAELEIYYINNKTIAYQNEDLDMEVYINVADLGDNEVYHRETLYEIVDRLGGAIVEVYVSGEEL